MQSLLYVIAIMGCGEGDAPCREVQVAPPRFASEAACSAATATVLERYVDLSYPSVVAQCRPAGAGAVQLRGRDVLRPAPGPAPRVRFAGAGPA
ncbi:MAG TPA: hypothetical protein VK614_06495 [Allosphingosinicella sp.]|nr:hypothetical protein [Allosphingosinicella sp.]